MTLGQTGHLVEAEEGGVAVTSPKSATGVGVEATGEWTVMPRPQ